MRRPHYINGRILLRDHGGVRRFASEVSTRMVTSTVLKPKSAARPWSGRWWEQTTLHRRAADGVLLNIAHSGPLRHPRHVMVIHDLLAFTNSGSVHPLYAALQKWQLPRLAASAAHIVTPSRLVADQVAATFKINPASITAVAPGISEAFQPGSQSAARSRLSLRNDQPVVAALLDPTPRKNSDATARLLQQLRSEQSQVQIVVAGRFHAPSFARIRRRTPPATRQGFIDLGPASDIELATMYQAADVFVALSEAEGFGLPMVEAAICGAAVVTTPVPSIMECAPESAVIAQDAKEAATAVRALLANPDRREVLRIAANEQLGDLRWAQTAATLEDIMDEVGRQ